MTTPSNSSDPAAGHPPPADPAAQQTDAMPAAPPATPGAPPPAPHASASLPPAPAEPFAPVARAPRTPWVNPSRRGHLAAAGIAAALVFGGGGFLIGHTTAGHADHRDRHGGVMHFQHLPGRDGPGPAPGRRPLQQDRPRHQDVHPPAAPTSHPSGGPTS